MATFYIDPTQPTNGVGTELDPFNTWTGMSWAAGNSYLQKSGTTWAGIFGVGASGTSGNEIYIGTYGGTERAVIDATGENRAILIFGRDYISVENIAGSNSDDSTFHVSSSSSNIIFKNCVATNFDNYGFFIDGSSAVLIDGGEAHSAAGSFSVGVNISGGATGVIVQDVSVYNVNGDGIAIIESDSNQVLRCRVGPIVKDAIALEDSDSNVIHSNIVVQDNAWGGVYPSLKLGDNFGVGTGAALNIIRHNCFSHASNSEGLLQASNCADSNTIEDNNYYAPNYADMFSWNTTQDATVAQGNYTYAEWVAKGKYDQESYNRNPRFDAQYSTSQCFPFRAPGGGITPRIVRHMRSDRWSGFVDSQNKIPQAKAPRRAAKDRIAELVAAELSMPKPPKKR